jgi:integrase
MSVGKRLNPSGKIVWFYQFDAAGSTRQKRIRIREFGFPTKQSAVEAERVRRIEEQKKYDIIQSGGPVIEIPETLNGLLGEFFREHAEQKLASKTTERYREQAAYLSPELRALPFAKITALHLSREWTRLLKSGGHTRASEERGPSQPRPLSEKTVRNIAGVISSAYSRAIRWGLATINPVTKSEPPIPKKSKKLAFTVEEHDALLASKRGPWWLAAFTHVTAALGARRGEVLALRWPDIDPAGRVTIARSLSQTSKTEVDKHGEVRKFAVLEFKGTKQECPHTVSITEETMAVLEAHRQQQMEFRKQYGTAYDPDGYNLIFANPDGSPLKPDSVSSTGSRLCRKMQMPRGASLHTLRHTHATHMFSAGVPINVVSERLGHSSTRVTADIYAHVIRGQDDEALLSLEEFKRKAREKTAAALPDRVQ